MACMTPAKCTSIQRLAGKLSALPDRRFGLAEVALFAAVAARRLSLLWAVFAVRRGLSTAFDHRRPARDVDDECVGRGLFADAETVLGGDRVMESRLLRGVRPLRPQAHRGGR